MQRRRFVAALGAAAFNPAIQVVVDPTLTGAPIPRDFLGFGYEITSVSVRGLLAPENKVYLQLLRNLGSQGIIRIGGNTSDLASKAPSSFDDLGGFLRASGWKLIWGLNLGTGSPQAAAAQAAAVAQSAGDRLLCCQIGNEPDLYHFNGLRPSSYTYPDYLAEFRRFAAGLRVPLAGPDTANAPDWLAQFVRDQGTTIQFPTEHYYRANADDPAATIDTLLRSDARFEAMMRSLPARTRLCEINSFSGGGEPGVSDTFASTLWALDLMFTVAAYGGGGVNWETGLNHLGFVSSYSPIFQDDQGNFSARPLYYALLAFSKAGTGTLVPVRYDAAGANFRAYAVQDDLGQLWVTLINKDAVADANIQLQVPRRFSRGELSPLTAPSIDSTGGVRFAAAQVAADGSWHPGRQYRFRISGGSTQLSVPAATAMVVRLGGLAGSVQGPTYEQE